MLKKYVSDFMLGIAITTILKKYAVTIVPKAWKEGILDKTTNIASGFRSAGLRPLYFPAMQGLPKLFKDGSIANSEENPTWMRCQETVRTEVLSLPPAIDRRLQRRRKIDVNNLLLSREQTIQIDPQFFRPLV